MCYTSFVRTTLDIEDDVLQIAKQLALQRRTTAGRIVSDLLRQALEPKDPRSKLRNGVPLFTPTPGARKPSLHLVNKLRDET